MTAIVEYFPITKVGTGDDPEQTFLMPTTVVLEGQRADAARLSQQMLAMAFCVPLTLMFVEETNDGRV